MFDIYKLKKESAELRGKEEGIEQNNLEIAKKMLQKDYSLEQVKEITGLTETELKQMED